MKQSKNFIRLLRADALRMTIRSLLISIKENSFSYIGNDSINFAHKKEMGLMLFQAHKIKINNFSLLHL
jgi:hypothetical protein